MVIAINNFIKKVLFWLHSAWALIIHFENIKATLLVPASYL